jgi:hypothetical protein
MLDEIDRSIVAIRGFKGACELEKSYLAKFLVVYICGIYEEAIECIVNERVTTLGSDRLNRFLESYLDRNFRNPDISKIGELLGLFDKVWKKEVKGLSNKAKQSFFNILANKNALAHGIPCNVTFDEVVKYYTDSIEVIEKIDNIVQFK